MNVRLRRQFAWNSGLVYQGEFSTNNYSADLSLITSCNDPREQNVAYERMKYFVYSILNSGIIVSHDCKNINAWRDTGTRLIVLPEQPVDQIVGMMLFTKLNAIMEGRMSVTEVAVCSQQGDEMIYLHSENETLGPLSGDGWWNDPKPITAMRSRSESKKVLSLDRAMEWKDLGLDWEDDKEDPSSVVFANFRRDED